MAAVGGVDRDAEFQSLRLGLDVRGSDGEWQEDGKLDLANVGAGAWYDEHLVQGGEGERAGAGGKEGKSAGDFAEKVAVEAVLLAFLADDGGNAADQARIAILTKEGCHVPKSTEDDIGKGRCQTDCGEEVGDGEVVLARLDWADAKVGERAIGVEGVKLFLRLNSCDSGDYAVSLIAVCDLVTREIIRDVGEQLGEEGHLEKLVEGNQLETGLGVRGDGWRRRAIGERAMCLDFDGCELRGRVGDIWKAIR